MQSEAGYDPVIGSLPGVLVKALGSIPNITNY